MTAVLLTEASSWQVLVRDISDRAPIDGFDETFLCLVLDADQGRVRAVGTGGTASRARVSALVAAATEPAPPFDPGLPELIVCPPGGGENVRDDLAVAFGELGGSLPPVIEEPTSPGVEEFFDEVIDQLPDGPDNLPSEEEWQQLVAGTLQYALAQPWSSWPPDLQLHAQLTVEEESTSYVVAVLGGDGMPSGLVLYPGRDQSDVILPDENWAPTDPLPFRPGTLLLHLNPPEEAVEDMAELAVEFGWPSDAAVMPVWLSAGPDGFTDIERVPSLHLSLALAAVLERTGHALDKPAPELTATLPLPAGGECRYVVADLPRGGAS